jgi:hypothetical protein
MKFRCEFLLSENLASGLYFNPANLGFPILRITAKSDFREKSDKGAFLVSSPATPPLGIPVGSHGKM